MFDKVQPTAYSQAKRAERRIHLRGNYVAKRPSQRRDPYVYHLSHAETLQANWDQKQAGREGTGKGIGIYAHREGKCICKLCNPTLQPPMVTIR